MKKRRAYLRNNKRRVNQSRSIKNREDRLSSLPDAILVDILRLLPFKLAVSTSILSTRWCNLWTEHTSIDIYLIHFLREICKGNVFFSKLPGHVLKSCTTINRILERLTSPNLTTFNFHFNHICLQAEDQYYALSSCVETWLPLICGRNIEVIKLVIGNSPDRECEYEHEHEHDPFIWLPPCIFQTQSLVKLELMRSNYNCRLPNVISLPHLKDLKLDLGNFKDFHRRLLSTLSEACPLLQNLCLDIDLIDDEYMIHVSSYSLKCLAVMIWNKYPDFERIESGKFVIDAPNLDCIDICGSFRGSYEFVRKPTKLTKADIAVDIYYYVQTLGLLQGISCARSLALVDGRGYSIDLLNFWEDRGGLPLFSQLNELHIVFDFDECNGSDRFPAPMLNKVKKIKIEYNNGLPKDMRLLQCILSNSFDLDLLSVSVTYMPKKDHYEKEREFTEALFMLERSSKNCQIQFTGDCSSA